MPRGRPRKSPREKQLEGSRSPTRVVEVFAPNGVPFVPDHIQGDAERCMRNIIANYPSKHLGHNDSYALAAFAAAWAWHKHAFQAMSQPGFEAVEDRTDKNGTTRRVVNPWFKILNEQARVMTMLGAKLYLSPADRHLLDNTGQDQPKSKFDGLIGRTKSSDLLSVSSSPLESDKENDSDS